MTTSKNGTLSQGEAQTYLHLGTIAANTGYGQGLYQTRQQIADGNRGPSHNDLLAGVGTFVLIRPAQTFYERIILPMLRSRHLSGAWTPYCRYRRLERRQ